MAQKKIIEAPSGADATYWIPVEVALNFLARVGRVTVAGYVNAAARQNGKTPLDFKHLEVTPEAFRMFEENPVQKAARIFFDDYKAGDFAGAEKAEDVEAPPVKPAAA